MTFDQITVFASLAKQLNMTKAAHELRTTQPNLSKHLKALEETLHRRLFTRHSKGLKLTEKGREFLGDVEPLIVQWQRINRWTLNDTTAKTTVVRLSVAGTYGAAATLLPAPLALFKKTHPDVELSMRSNSTVKLEELVLAGELELALCSKLPTSSLLMAEHYLTSKVVLFVAPDDLLSEKKNLTLADVAKLPLIVRSETSPNGGTATFFETIRQRRDEPSIALRCDQPEAIIEAARCHSGVGVLYYETIEHALKYGALKELKVRDLNIEGRLYIIYHKVRPLSPPAAAFLEVLREERNRKVTKAGVRSQTSEVGVTDRIVEIRGRRSEHQTSVAMK